MGTRETRLQRGRRQGDEVLRRLIGELRTARELAGVSQRTIAREVAWSQSEVARLEGFQFPSVALLRLCEIGAVLGLDLSASFHPAGDAVRDRGHQKVRARTVGIVASPPYEIAHEALFPGLEDLRTWDLLLRLGLGSKSRRRSATCRRVCDASAAESAVVAWTKSSSCLLTPLTTGA